MPIAYVLIGFLIGQIITLEGVRLSHLMAYLVSLWLIAFFTVLPALAFVTLVYSFEWSPAMILGASIIVCEGIRCFLCFIGGATPHHSYAESSLF